LVQILRGGEERSKIPPINDFCFPILGGFGGEGSGGTRNELFNFNYNDIINLVFISKFQNYLFKI
jgi:hypothetical protein